MKLVKLRLLLPIAVLAWSLPAGAQTPGGGSIGISPSAFGSPKWRDPVSLSVDLPACNAGSVWHVRTVAGPSPTIYWCDGTGPTWTALTGAAGSDTTCLDAGVSCLFAASLSEGGPATTASAAAANPANCSTGNAAAGVGATWAAEGCFDVLEPGEVDTLAELNTLLGASIADGAHTVDTNCNSAGVTCLFAASSSEGGAASDLACTGCVADAELALDYCQSDGTGCAPSGGGGAATAIDADSDATDEVFVASSAVRLDPDDDGDVDLSFLGGGGAGLDGEIRPGTGGNLVLCGNNYTRVCGGGQVRYDVTTAGAFVCSTGATGDVRMICRADGVGPVYSFIGETGGFGRAGATGAYAIFDGTETARLATDSVGVTVNNVLSLMPRASAPATCGQGSLYMDSSGALCLCAATNTWAMVFPTVPTSENCS